MRGKNRSAAWIVVLGLAGLLAGPPAPAQRSALAELVDQLRQGETGQGTLEERLEAARQRDRAKRPPLRPLTEVKALAEEGDVEAQVELGMRYLNGREAPRDNALAARWYRSAAEAGHPEAQYWYGYILQYDQPGALRSEVVAWYRRAADAGHASAEYRLGSLAEYGDGVPQDLRLAAEHYERASLGGHGGAMNRLGLLLAQGRLGAEDAVQGLAWYLACAAVHRGCGAHAEDFAAIAATLTSKQRATAAAKARELVGRILDDS